MVSFNFKPRMAGLDSAVENWKVNKTNKSQAFLTETLSVLR